MKKLIPFLISGILVAGTFGCSSDSSKTTSESTTAPVKEAAQKTETAVKETGDKAKTAIDDAGKKTETAAKGALNKVKTSSDGAKTIVKNKLAKAIPGSKLDVAKKDGILTITGTVPTKEDLAKIEPIVKEYKFEGVKGVKVEAKSEK
ncbi:hypothetical protein IJ00_07265 [Calothrix sp. 336/3]|nr:BON domain-containing protein [Calothrix sp. 336/3]AKG24504.1 hypothetical protein IJ00_07265 [Calothrix sp. 336/3]